MTCAEKQESIAHTQKKKQSIETVPEEAKILHFTDQGFKPALKKMFRMKGNHT